MTYQRDASKSLDDEIQRAENVFDWVLKEQEHIIQSTNRKEELLRQVEEHKRKIEEYKTNIERMGNEMKKEERDNEKTLYEVRNELCKMHKEKHDKEKKDLKE